MCENDLIEMEDFNFNHYLHHFDECESDCMVFNEEYQCIESVTECMEEFIWN